MRFCVAEGQLDVGHININKYRTWRLGNGDWI